MKTVSICVMLGVLAAGLAGYAVLHPQAATPTAPAPSVLVTELALTPGSMPATLVAYGSIQPGPGGEHSVAPQASGSLASLAVGQGQPVAAGQLLATLDPDAAAVADAQKAADALAAATANFAHVSALLASHLATKADLAAAAQTLRDTRATLAAMRATGAGRPCRLVAPFDGTVTEVLAMPGTVFASGTPLLRIASQAGLIAEIGLPPDQAAKVKLGDAATLSLLDTGNSLPATVSGIGGMLDPQTGLLPLRLALTSKAGIVLNQPVQAVITAQTLRGYLLPHDAVRTDDTGDFIYQVDARSIAHRVPVHALVQAPAQTLIAAGIDANLPVVVTGAAQLADGMAVRTAP